MIADCRLAINGLSIVECRLTDCRMPIDGLPSIDWRQSAILNPSIHNCHSSILIFNLQSPIANSVVPPA
jgi:hypothetical protein